jgi:hypothetical protein
MDYPQFEKLVEQSVSYLTACNAKACRLYGIGDYPRYEYDLHRGEMWWSEGADPKVRARVTIVGTLGSDPPTWLWSWANSHFDRLELGPIDKVRQFGEEEEIPKLTDPQWEAEEADGWEMAAVAARLLESQGAYRSPGSTCQMFLLFDGLEFIPEEEKSRYLPLRRPEE